MRLKIIACICKHHSHLYNLIFVRVILKIYLGCQRHQDSNVEMEDKNKDLKLSQLVEKTFSNN